VPDRALYLAPMSGSVAMQRVDERSLRIRPEHGWLDTPVERLIRDDRPFRVGERVDRPGYAVRVDAVNDAGRPTVATFTFEHPLEDPRYRWNRPEGLTAVAWAPPAPGGESYVPAWSPFAR
jgi:hypothetical protein